VLAAELERALAERDKVIRRRQIEDPSWARVGIVYQASQQPALYATAIARSSHGTGKILEQASGSVNVNGYFTDHPLRPPPNYSAFFDLPLLQT
jgi:hypothetical protein